MGKLEQSNIVRYTNIQEGLHGTFMADVIINGVSFERKTFFPQHWSREKVIEKIFESLQNLSEPLVLQSNGNYKLIGKTLENIEIETIIDHINKKIITSYPSMKAK